MDSRMKVPVFTSDSPAEVQLIKSKLSSEGIESTTENTYLGFTTTPTATALKVMVPIQQEAEAFRIIDEYLQAKN